LVYKDPPVGLVGELSTKRRVEGGKGGWGQALRKKGREGSLGSQMASEKMGSEGKKRPLQVGCPTGKKGGGDGKRRAWRIKTANCKCMVGWNWREEKETPKNES